MEQLFKFLGDLFKGDDYIKKVFKVFVTCAVAFIIWQLLAFEWDADHGRYAKFLWFERNIPDPAIRHDTTVIIKQDTFGFKPNISHSQPTIKTHESIKKVANNSQKIDNGSSGLQNNAPNYGNQAGHDMTINNIDQAPQITAKDIDEYVKDFPQKDRKVNFVFGGPVTAKMVNVQGQFVRLLHAKGYSNIDPRVRSYVSPANPATICYGAYIFVVPPYHPGQHKADSNAFTSRPRRFFDSSAIFIPPM